MPHDLAGTELAKGDIVTMKFEVQDVSVGETACNCTLKAIRTACFDEPYLPIVACNTKLVAKIDDSPRAN